MRHVVEACRSPLYSDDDDRAGLVLFVGADAHGVPLEVVGIELPDEVLLIIHAMRLRARNSDDYEWVMRWFER